MFPPPRRVSSRLPQKEGDLLDIRGILFVHTERQQSVPLESPETRSLCMQDPHTPLIFGQDPSTTH